MPEFTRYLITCIIPRSTRPAFRHVIENQPVIATTFVVYLGAMFLLGWVAFRRTRDLSDYILGGRKLGRWVTALSAGASDMSGWLLLGLPGYAYLAGLEAGWIALGLLIGTWLNWRLVARRLRVYSALAGNALTLPEFFEHRFRDRSHALRILSGVFILLFFLFYTSAGLVAGGKLFATVFGLPYEWAVVTGAAAIIVYTFLGGFLAVSWTDLVQGLLMALALVLVPVAGVVALGGVDAAIQAMAQRNTNLLDAFTSAQGEPLTWLAIASLLGWGLGYFGQPHILARFKAIRDPDELPGARRIAIGWVSVALAGALAAGFTGIGYLPEPLADADSEKVFMLLVGALLQPIPAGIALAAILAAVMSTADSQLLVSSSTFTEDFYRSLIRRDAQARELVMVGRAAVVVIATVACVLALDRDSKVLDLVSYAWAGFGAAFGPTVLGSLFWRRMTARGALAGILTGGITVVVWKQLNGGIFDLYEIVPGFVFSALAIVIASLTGAPPPREVRREFDEVAGRST